MAPTVDWYKDNPLTHRDRRLRGSPSAWVRSFACEDLRPLIVCRGPIRKEAMDVFEEMGMRHYGILVSEKDSIVYPNALAPELRQLTDNTRVHRVPDYTGATKEERVERMNQIVGIAKDSIVYPNALAPELRQLTDNTRVHRVPDYTGATKEERVERMNQIVGIAKDNGYDSIFAGYGFMAEDGEFVATVERAGLKFIGPNSATQERAGKKDEAKKTALSVKVSVTPGINNVTARTLLREFDSRKKLLLVDEAREFHIDRKILDDESLPLEDLADAILNASYAKGMDLFTVDELAEQVQREVTEMFRKYPRSRVRLKAIGGGGGKGQRILGGSLLTARDPDERMIAEAAAAAPAMLRETLAEAKAAGVGDNKNVLIELNI